MTAFSIMSLDGYSEGSEPWDIRFHRTVVDGAFEKVISDLLSGAERLLFGRATFIGMARRWQMASGSIALQMNSLPKLVFSRNASLPHWENTSIVDRDAPQVVAELKKCHGRSLVLGSAKLCNSLFNQLLIDELHVVVAPVMLGSGAQLFEQRRHSHYLQLLDVKLVGAGGILAKYQVIHAEIMSK